MASNSTENEGSNNHKTVTWPPTAERTYISTILTVRLFFLPFDCSRSPYMPAYSDLIYTPPCPPLSRVLCPFTTTFLSFLSLPLSSLSTVCVNVGLGPWTRVWVVFHVQHPRKPTKQPNKQNTSIPPARYQLSILPRLGVGFPAPCPLLRFYLA